MRIFHREFTIIAGLLVLRVLTTFSGYYFLKYLVEVSMLILCRPVAMNRLLQYVPACTAFNFADPT
jgi:hypothetical protein